MTFTHRELSQGELIDHVAKHESAYVQRYAAARESDAPDVLSSLSEL